MQEYCPLCSKNGIKAKIKAYQLNLQEAVFMCSGPKCAWPAGFDNPLFINRPVGKDWSENWDNVALKHLKSDQDTLLDFSAYTPPRTPSNEITCKDTSCYNSSVASVPDKLSNSTSVIIEENVNKSQDFCTVVSNECEISVVNNSISNNISTKPKLMVSKPVHYKLEKLPHKGYVFIKDNDNNDEPCKKNSQLSNIKNKLIRTPTSLVNNSVFSNTKNLSHNLSMRNSVKKKPKTRFFSRKRQLYEKFDFNELIKQKNDAKKECKENLRKDLDLIQTKREENEMDCSKVVVNNSDVCSIDNFDINEFLKSESTNVNENLSLNVNSNEKTQTDCDSIWELDEFLANFDGESTLKNDLDDSNDPDWIRNLLECTQ